MPAKLKAVLKGLGYALFFFVALLFFVYATLPLDALESYMVRKASDEYGTDLEITEMSMWGLSGLSMEGVTITPRPTPEEITAIREARAARAAWQARQQAKAAEAAGEGADEAAGDADKGKAAQPEPAKAKTADAKGPDGADKAPAAARATPGKAVKDEAKAEDEKPPPVPAGPQPLHIESLRAKVALGKLISDLTDGQLLDDEAEAVLEARVLGGAIDARVERNTETTHLVAQFSGLDLQQLTVLRTLLPLPVLGGFEGEVDVEIPQDDKGQLRLASTAGHLSISLSNAVLGPGRIENDGLRNFGGFFDVPRLTLARFGGKINFERRRAVFEDFAFQGKDLEGDLTGYVQLANKLDRFNPRAYLRFKFADAFLEREKGIKTLMSVVPEIKKGTGSDGFTGFAVSVKTDPRSRGKKLSWRPTPRNPYVRNNPRAGAAEPPSVRPGRSTLRDRNTTRSRTRTGAKKPRLPSRTAKPSTVKAVEPIEVDTPDETDDDEPETEVETEQGDEDGEEGAEGEDEAGSGDDAEDGTEDEETE